MIETSPLRRKLLQLAVTGKLSAECRVRSAESVSTTDSTDCTDGRARSPVSAEAKPSSQSEQCAPSDSDGRARTPAAPAGWKMVKLGEVCEFINGDRGSNYPSKKTLTSVGDVPFISAINLENGTVRKDNLLYLSYDRYHLLRAGKLVRGDVALCIRGSLGKYCVYPYDEGAIASSLVILRCNREISNQYLSAFIESSMFEEQMRKYDNGTAQPNLAAKDVMRFLLPLPPLAEQKAIVKRLEELLALEREIAADSAALDDLITAAKRKILQLAVTGKLSAECRVRSAESVSTTDSTDCTDGRARSPVSAEAKPSSQSESLEQCAPHGWKTVKLGDVFSHNTGKALNRRDTEGEMKPYLTTSNVYWNHFELDDLKQMPFSASEIEKCTVEKGDLLVCEGGDVGRANIWNENYSVCIQNHIHRLRPILPADSRFYRYVLWYKKLTGQIAGKGIGLQGLSSRALHEIPIPLPPLAEQKEIVAKVEELFAVLDAMKGGGR